MEVDVLDYTTEEILSIECEDGKQRSVETSIKEYKIQV